MGHFSRVLDGFGRWFMVIMVFLWSGRNGFIQMISHLSSLTCCSACWQEGRWRVRCCWPMSGPGCWILTNQRPAEGRPDGPGHPSHSDHRPAVRSERGTRAFLSQIKFVKNKENQKEWETVSSTGMSGYMSLPLSTFTFLNYASLFISPQIIRSNWSKVVQISPKLFKLAQNYQNWSNLNIFSHFRVAYSFSLFISPRIIRSNWSKIVHISLNLFELV